MVSVPLSPLGPAPSARGVVNVIGIIGVWVIEGVSQVDTFF